MKIDPFAPFLARSGAAVVDGAFATELERRGADLRDPLWSARVLLEQPSLIRAVHDDYFAAGADVAITATYQATFEGLKTRGLDAAAAALLMRSAVQIAIDSRDAYWSAHSSRQASDMTATMPVVAASVGPYGAFLADGSEYVGNYALDDDALVAWHRPRFAVLANSGADLLACETIPCGAEARAFLRLLSEHRDARAWISFAARDGAHIASGERFADLARECGAHPQVVAVGINCTAPQHVASLIRDARAATDAAIVVYPNSGETYDAVSHGWLPGVECASFADAAERWLDAGATIVGGCCRTSPDDIRAVRALVDRRRG
jgi:homocysteine S-methyltransferase